MKKVCRIMSVVMVILFITASSWAEEDAAELAKKLSNPVANLISVPLQSNWDFGIEAPDEVKKIPGLHFRDAYRYTLNVQPVIPISISEDWNVIIRAIVPFIHAESPVKELDDQEGLADIVNSFFFSPKAPTSGGWIWGAGPVFLLPIGSDDLLTADKWGAGPTGVVLRQGGPWTYGMLANHIWSFAGNDNREDVSNTFLQPFLSYTTPTAWTFTLNTETTYDWKNEQWTVPINGVVSKVTKIGSQLISVGGGVRYWADSPDSGPEGLGIRLVVTLLFPK